MIRHRGAAGAAGEGGAVVVLVSCCMLFLLAVAAVVFDLGQAVVGGRQMQNAADAAALAGARQLDKVRLATPLYPISPTTVDAVVHLVATRNGAVSTFVTCTVIQWDSASIGPCSDVVSVVDPLAAGVLVSAGTSAQTIFGGALGTAQLRQDRVAAATVQPLIGQSAPLLVCAFGHPLPSPSIFVAVSPVGVTPVTYAVNPLAVGRTYLAHAPQVSDCGLAGSAWKGVAAAGVVVVPGWIDIGTGVQAGPIRSQLAGQQGCTSVTLGCMLALPVCSGSNGLSGSNGRLLCEHFAVFKLTSQTSNSQTFMLMAGAEAISGIGGTGLSSTYEARVIKLII